MRMDGRPISPAVLIAWSLIAASVPLAAVLAGDPPPEPPPPVSEVWSVMGTRAAVSIPETDHRTLTGRAAVVKDIFRELDEALSVYKADSEISRLNRGAGKEAVPVSARTLEILRLARKYAELSGGAFDPTVLPLCRLWGFSGGSSPRKLPSPDEIEGVRRLVGYRRLVIAEGAARLELPGMGVDLGGIAKGYAVDLAFDRLAATGAADFLVDLGGNLRCRGSGRRGRPWTVGVRDPFDRSRIVGVLALTGGLAVATSGNYERFVEIDGERHAHILDPRTGRPVKGMAGVTVVCPTAVETDALSTALFVLGPSESLVLLARLPGAEAILIPDRRPLEILITPGMRRLFEPETASREAVKVLEKR
jgi:thiamine biosynthesis lipoprotein